ncbi:hypothetical protein R3Q06_32400 [Rhodococcus erythropolis]|uniref:hypothetical protein n=1 Tax=Rhodococcus erythropolis TaxID=1833 RepID=UPI00294A2D74|nr:hypothetical protein [Rhodococcus erythropolis]MDV6278171.1 hypothetical protein [Rhodococcus erythropolis]
MVDALESKRTGIIHIMTISSKNGRLYRMRNLASISLVAAAAAGAICSGAGISTAAVDTGETIMPTHTTDAAASDTFDWSVTNHTGRPIYGTWDAQNAEGRSHIESSVGNPWKPDDHADAHQRGNALGITQWKAVICYNENTWTFETNMDTTDFSLEVDSKGALHAIYYDHDVFGRTRYVTPFVRRGSCQAPES